MTSLRKIALALPLLAATTACNSESGKVCTTLYALIPVTVVNAQGAPVTGMTISDSILRTHEHFTVPPLGGIFAPGTYQAFSDSYSSKVRESGDAVTVSGTDGTLTFSAAFVFGTPGGCHVAKISGPDTVIAR